MCGWYNITLAADAGDFFQVKEMPSLRNMPYLTVLNHKEKAIATISVQKQREQKLAAFVKVQVWLHVTEKAFALLGGS